MEVTYTYLTVYKLYGELMSLFSNLKHAFLAKRVYARLQKEARLGHLKTALFALGGMLFTAVVAKLTSACPDLLSSGGAILTACIAGGVAFWMKRPKAAPVATSLVIGFITAVGAGGIDALRSICGTAFITQLPTILTAVGWTTLGLWLTHPREQA